MRSSDLFCPKLSIITLSIFSYISYGFAQENREVQGALLEQIEVISKEPNGANAKVGETVKTEATLKRQQVQDSRDLVRYDTGVSVVEAGRFGTSGYAIRGVDENRVAINIDGLRQAETLSSQGFKELFEGYGNFNNTRNGIEIENVQRARIQKGADSISSGSGALGGAVTFKTKEASDFLKEKNWHLGYKAGYASANDLKTHSVTLAGKALGFDALAVVTRRHSHELENYGYKHFYANAIEDRADVGQTRKKTDPYQIRNQSKLIKLGFEPNENHRISVTYDSSQRDSNGADLSNSLQTLDPTNNNQQIEKKGDRYIHDESHRKNIQLSYTHTDSTPLWDKLTFSVSHQKIKNKARADHYCQGNACLGVQNPAGLGIKEENGVYHFVDKAGNKLVGDKIPEGWGYSTRLLDSSGNELNTPNEYYLVPTYQIMFDCEKYNCNNKVSVWNNKDANFNDVYAFTTRDIQTYTASNDKKYGMVVPQYRSPTSIYQEELNYILPRRLSRGFEENQYNDRDLNTQTKQFNLELDKIIELKGQEHQFKYGLLYETSEKSMVAYDGYEPANVQWWASNFVCAETVYDENARAINYIPKPDLWARPGNCTNRHGTQERSSYLIPVKTETKAFHLGDNIRFNDRFAMDVRYRYDRITLKPSYDPATPIPKGLIAGIFVPTPEPWYLDNSSCGYHSACLDENVKQNLAVFANNRKFSHHSYSIAFTFDPLDWFKIQTKYANGFRVPTSDELFMTFKHPSFSIAPNVTLKPEQAKTKEIAFTFYQDNSFLTIGAFRTDYRNFIDLSDAEYRRVDSGALNYPFYRSINRDRASVEGIELSSHLALGDIDEKLSGLHIGYKMTHQKGRIHAGADGKIPMNAIQPTTSVFNIGYTAPNEKYSIDLYATHVASKKAGDTYNSEWKSQMRTNTMVQGKPVTDSSVAWRNGAYTIFDFITHYRPIKNLTLSAGLFNMTNKKYMTWDSARSIRTLGALNRINQNSGEGIQRFYAPGRNYRLTAEFSF